MKNLTLELNTLIEADETFKDLGKTAAVRVAFLYNNEPQTVLSQNVVIDEVFTIYNTKLSPGPVNIISEDVDGVRTVLGTIARGAHLDISPLKTETLELFVQRAEPITGLYVGVLVANN